MNEQIFLQEVKEANLYHQALSLLEWDSQTGMPLKSHAFRDDVRSYLSKCYFEKRFSPIILEALTYFAAHPDELSPVGKAVFKKIKQDYKLNQSIPSEKMAAYAKVLGTAHANWLAAREAKDFTLFKASLAEIIQWKKEFITYWKQEEATDYDVLLNQYEPGMTVAKLDQLFAKLKGGIQELRALLQEKGVAPRTDFVTRKMKKAQQRQFVCAVAEQIGYDFSRGRLDDTVHPFMLQLNRQDVRITTRWDENFFSTAVFGVLHEAGHGIYEQNVDEKYDYTPLAMGASMGMHESQSLFYEVMIGGNASFWEGQYSFFQSCAPTVFDDISLTDFYRGLKHTQASFVRIEADTLTYALHIMIRYEIEKMIFNEGLTVDALAEVWAQKYEEYLGIRPADDLEGILQDIHWAGGTFGYFPSYALGYMYAAQLLAAMKKELPVEQLLREKKYTAIRAWLTEHIHQYGAAKEPLELIQAATDEPLNPQYLIDYLKATYLDAYQIK